MWDNQGELYLKNIAIESQILYLANRDCYQKYHQYSLCFQLPCILISSVSAALSFNSDFMLDKTNQLIIGSMGILVASLGSVYNALNYKFLETIHFHLSDEYLNLYELIRQNLEKQIDQRISYNDLIELVDNKRLELFKKNSGILKPEIIKYYKHKYKNNLELPLVFNHIRPIIINSSSMPPTPLTPSINVSEDEFIV